MGHVLLTPQGIWGPIQHWRLKQQGSNCAHPLRLKITLTTNRQALKWFCSRGRCAHQAINFCGAPLSNKPPWLPPFSSALLLGSRTTPLAVLCRKGSDKIKPACHRPTCCCSIIEQTCLGCCCFTSGYVLQQLIVFAVAMVVVVKVDCQSFAAVDIVVNAAAVVVVYSSPLPSWGEWRQPPSLPLQGG